MAFNVRWLDMPLTQCDYKKINELIDELESSDLKKIPWYSISNFLRVYKTWCINVDKDKGVCIRVVKGFNDIHQYCFNKSQAQRDNEEKPSGAQAYRYVESIFEDIYGSRKSLFQAFSAKKYENEYRAIKACVPKPINWILDQAAGIEINHVWKADVSSAYPFEGTKKLPTLEGCKKLKGYGKPTKDFPFAFYTKSHHIAIYGELDTHKWSKYKKYYTLYESQFNDNVTDEETILCRASDYSMKPVFDIIYQKKQKGSKIAKLGMNAFIGMCHKNSNPRLSHIAACILARCCDRMLNITSKIEKENPNNIVIFIGTDSIVWRGKKSSYATDDKYIGSFTYEYHDTKFFARGPKAYQIISDDGEIITKYAGMANGKDKSSLAFGKIPKLAAENKKIVICDDGRIEEIYG